MIDDEEIVKALSLEEQALDEFKRRKNSLPPQQTYSARSSGGKILFLSEYSTSIIGS